MALYPPPTRRQVENVGTGLIGLIVLSLVGVFEVFWYLFVLIRFAFKVVGWLIVVAFFVWPLPLVIMGLAGDPKLLLFGLWWVVIGAIEVLNGGGSLQWVKEKLVGLGKATGFVEK